MSYFNFLRSNKSEKEYREYRGRSKDRSYDKRDRRDSSRERRPPPAQYVEQVPFPIYYGAVSVLKMKFRVSRVIRALQNKFHSFYRDSLQDQC